MIEISSSSEDKPSKKAISISSDDDNKPLSTFLKPKQPRNEETGKFESFLDKEIKRNKTTRVTRSQTGKSQPRLFPRGTVELIGREGDSEEPIDVEQEEPELEFSDLDKADVDPIAGRDHLREEEANARRQGTRQTFDKNRLVDDVSTSDEEGSSDRDFRDDRPIGDVLADRLSSNASSMESSLSSYSSSKSRNSSVSSWMSGSSSFGRDYSRDLSNERKGF